MRFILSHILSFSLIFQFSASAFADVKLQREHVAQYLQSAGFNNKGKTYKDLDLFLSVHLPENTYNLYKNDLKKMGNKPLPKISFSTIKNGEGVDAVKLILTEDKKTHVIELNPNYLQSMNETAIRADGVALSLADLIDPKKIGAKYLAKYPNKSSVSSDPFNNPYADNSSFGGNFLIPDKAYWARLSPEQKAKFIIELRKLWIASQKVREVFAKNKTASLEKSAPSLEKFEAFLQLLIERADAQAVMGGKAKEQKKPSSSNNGNNAASATPAQKTPPATLQPSASAKATDYGGASPSTLLIATSGKGYCINRGYIGKTSNSLCRHPSTLSDAEIKNDPLLQQQKASALSTCSSSEGLACNPSIYMGSRGNICTASTAGYGKKATHFSGECESNSPLYPPSERFGAELDEQLRMNPGAIDPKLLGDLQESLLNKLRAKDGMTKSDGSPDTEGMAAMKKFTEDFIKNKSGFKDDDSFFNVVNAFYNDINQDLQVCQAMFKSESTYKKASGKKAGQKSIDASEQLGACQALLVRKLSFDIGLGQLCPQVFAKEGRTNSELSSITTKAAYSKESGSCLKANVSPIQALPVEVKEKPIVTIDCENNKCHTPTQVPPLTPEEQKKEEEAGFCTKHMMLCLGGAALAGSLLGYLLAKDNNKNTKCGPGTTPSGNSCIKSFVCENGSVNVSGNCIKTGICTGDAIMVNNKCTYNCPPGMAATPKGCAIQYVCPGTGIAVTNLNDCTEGGTGSGGGSVGGTAPVTQ